MKPFQNGENWETMERLGKDQEFCFGNAVFEIFLGHPYVTVNWAHKRGRNRGCAGSHPCIDRNSSFEQIRSLRTGVNRHKNKIEFWRTPKYRIQGRDSIKRHNMK